jgi:anti-sigma factor RsiW
MSQSFQCGDGGSLVSYLYDECSPEERRAIAAHLLRCNACAEEVAGFERTREHVAGWTPPEVKLGFSMVADMNRQSDPPEAHWWQRPLPVWAQAAAAAAIFGIGLSLGVARGSMGPTADRLPAQAAVARPSAAPTVSATDLAALEQRLRAEMIEMQTSSAPQTTGESQLLERVRALIQESEERQQRELAFRSAQIMRDVDAQRRVDLAQIERTFGQMEGTAGVQVEQNRQLLNYLMRVSQTPR